MKVMSRSGRQAHWLLLLLTLPAELGIDLGGRVATSWVCSLASGLHSQLAEDVLDQLAQILVDIAPVRV